MKDITKVIDTYNKTAEHYAKNRAGKEPKVELDKFIKLISQHGKVLDVGCAAGRDSRILKDAGLEVVGIDLSEELLRIAKSQNPDINFILSDMRKLPFDDKSFDGIWASAVLHHLKKAEIIVTIREFKRILKPKGILLIKTKKGKGILRIREEIIMNKEREFTLVSESEIDQMLSSIGFRKIELYTTKSITREIHWVCAIYRKK